MITIATDAVQTGRRTVFPKNNPQNRRILYLEDEQDLINMVGLVMRRQGFEVIGATSVSRAIKFLEEQNFDLVFVDLNVGEDSGWDLIDHLNQHDSHAHVPKVIVSAQTLDYKCRTETGYGTHYDEIVSKPFPINTLLDVTERLLDRFRPMH